MSLRYVIIDAANKVVNAIIAEAGYTPAAGFTAIQTNQGNIGDTYSGGIFTSPALVAPRWQVMKLTIRRRLRAVGKESNYDSVLATLTGAQAADFKDAIAVNNDDPQAISILNAIPGVVVSQIMAPDPNASWSPS